MRATALLLCIVVAACGGSETTAPSPVAPSTPAAFFALSGTVADAITSAPVAGVTLTVMDGPDARRTVTSGGDGRYSLARLTAGSFTIVATMSGYQERSASVTLASDTTLNLTLDRTRVDLTGAWQVAATYSFEGTNRRDTGTGNVTQTNDVVTGNYTLGRMNGSIDVRLSPTTLGGTLTGTVHIDADSTAPNIRCTATIPVTGTVSAVTTFRIDGGLVPLANCDSTLRDFALTLTR